MRTFIKIYLKKVDIGSSGLKISVNDTTCFIVDVFGTNYDICGSVRLYLSNIGQIKIASFGTKHIFSTIKYVKTNNGKDVYFFHSGCFLIVGFITNYNKKLPEYEIINSIADIPNDAIEIEY